MTDTPIRKFMFDRSFEDGKKIHRTPERDRKPVTLRPEQVDALKKAAWDEGFAAGKKAGADEQAHRLQTTLSQMEGRMLQLIENFQAVHKSQEDELRRAVLAVARKILPDFTSREGLQEIQALLADAIGGMLHEPRLVVRVHESQFDDVNTKIHEITVQKAYAGKVVVLADAGIALNDCRIEWADGGIERNTEAAWQNVENVVAPEPNPNPPPSQE
ncbi:MAG: FliH/SctL family protein [Alphaproteobacteria bacterium]|nr:FliH/SctL family protein [Alphaproteobacteria bacterium]